MPLLTINLGNYANDGTGDDLRTAFEKVNANFVTLTNEIAIETGLNVGGGAGLFARKQLTNLEFKTLTSTSNTVEITSNTNTIDLHSRAAVIDDLTPTLGADLNLNGHKIYGTFGNIETRVYDRDITVIDNLLNLLLSSNSFVIDVGTITQPQGGAVNMGDFVAPISNHVDFGTF